MGSTRTVIVYGGHGQLGTEICRAARRLGHDATPLGREADATRPDTVTEAMRRHRPDVVVNCVGAYRIDDLEQEASRALAVNALAAHHVARAAAAAGARSVLVSTNHVFDGSKDPPADGAATPETAYVEDDLPHPVNVYGASKLAGEHLAHEADPGTLIVRCAALFGPVAPRDRGGNFVDSVRARVRRGERPRIVDDQWTSPTAAGDAADAIMRLALRPNLSGTVHVANRGAATWAELARVALELDGIDDGFDPVPTSQVPTLAPRPRNACLNVARAEDLLGSAMRPWQDALRDHVERVGAQ